MLAISKLIFDHVFNRKPVKLIKKCVGIGLVGIKHDTSVSLNLDWVAFRLNKNFRESRLQQDTNKFAQSNLGRGPRCGAVAYVRRKVPTGYNGAPKFAPKSTHSPVPFPKPHYIRPTYVGKRHPDPIRRFSTMHWTDRPTHARTHVRTDWQTDRSSTGKFNDYRPLRYESDAAMTTCRPTMANNSHIKLLFLNSKGLTQYKPPVPLSLPRTVLTWLI